MVKGHLHMQPHQLPLCYFMLLDTLWFVLREEFLYEMLKLIWSAPISHYLKRKVLESKCSLFLFLLVELLK